MSPIENFAAMRISVYEDPAPIKKLELGHRPADLVNFSWIPQTLGDQIWVVYEFASKDARESWEASIPETLRNLLDRNLIQHALPFGWGSRDENGFSR